MRRKPAVIAALAALALASAPVALAADPGLEAGVNVRHGAIVNPTVAEALAP